MLCKLLEHFSGTPASHSVIQLVGEGVYTARLRSLGIPVHSLGLQAARPSLRAIGTLRTLVNELKPDLIQGWMYHGNLAAELAKAFYTGPVLTVWNVRHSIDSMSDEKVLTRWVIRLGARFSKRPARIIYNSKAAAVQHEMLGYQESARVVIANGFDIDRFRFSSIARDRVRSNLGIPNDSFIVGMVARNHPIKDHINLVESANLLGNSGVDIRFVLAGAGTDAVDAAYRKRLHDMRITNRFHFLGEFDDIPALMSAIDVLVLPSRSEAFPNVLGEAMACMRPCIATDVGDCAAILGDCGTIIPPRSPSALAAAIQTMYLKSAVERADIGIRARERVEQFFGLSKIAVQYRTLYDTLLN
jgi:glycosyltransferase involved in cell wall biosynthesis